jgi:ribosomal protein S8E
VHIPSPQRARTHAPGVVSGASEFFRVTRGPRAGFARRDRPEAHASRPRSPPRAHPPVPEVIRTLTDPSPRLSSRYELGRQPANTKLSSHPDVRVVRCRGGNRKFRALRLDTGNFSWGSENTTHKTRILDVTYNASNNELVRRRTPSRAFPVPGVRRARSGCHGRRSNATEKVDEGTTPPSPRLPLPRSLTARARR